MKKRVLIEVAPSGRRIAQPWKVTEAGRFKSAHDLQAQAIKAAVAIGTKIVMAGGRAELKIKRPDGTIRDKRTYPRSSDPRPPRGSRG